MGTLMPMNVQPSVPPHSLPKNQPWSVCSAIVPSSISVGDSYLESLVVESALSMTTGLDLGRGGHNCPQVEVVFPDYKRQRRQSPRPAARRTEDPCAVSPTRSYR
jgi:hypothetical protein